MQQALFIGVMEHISGCTLCVYMYIGYYPVCVREEGVECLVCETCRR